MLPLGLFPPVREILENKFTIIIYIIITQVSTLQKLNTTTKKYSQTLPKTKSDRMIEVYEAESSAGLRSKEVYAKRWAEFNQPANP